MKVDGYLGGNIIGGDPDTFEPKLWDWIIDKFGVLSMVDVGCGEGQSLKYFRERGILAVGIDGLRDNCRVSGQSIVHDFTNGPLLTEGFDLCWCCEVIEHIDQEYEQNIIDTLAECRVIAITAAINPIGHHHVNLKTMDYWIDKFEGCGHKYLDEESRAGRLIADRVLFKNTGMIFGKVAE